MALQPLTFSSPVDRPSSSLSAAADSTGVAPATAGVVPDTAGVVADVSGGGGAVADGRGGGRAVAEGRGGGGAVADGRGGGGAVAEGRGGGGAVADGRGGGGAVVEGGGGVGDGGGGGGEEGGKAQRLPRWTRQEILVLIQGKRVAETRVRRGRTASMEFGSGQVEPKWATVSSYCRKHGVNRGPVQCRKRWSNLAGDFKKIKEYESQLKDETESFWLMRNDLRRERRLPGFFDKEVYDILDGGVGGSGGGGGGGGGGDGGGACLTLALHPSLVEVGVEVEPEAVFDSGRSAAQEDGLFSDFEQSGQDGGGSSEKDEREGARSTRSIPAPTPISVEKQYQPFSRRSPAHETGNEKEPGLDSGLGSLQSERKRKRYITVEDEEDDDTTTLQQQLIRTLDRNGKLISSHLEAQNSHCELEREQQKDHFTNLVAVLGKVADALGKIADKL